MAQSKKSEDKQDAPQDNQQQPEAVTDAEGHVIYGPDSQVGATGGEPAASGYVENPNHIPDPTAMTGTLETSGTGGGHNERISGTTRIFGDVEQVVGKVEAVVASHLTELVDEVRGVLKREETNAVAANLPQQTVENGGVPEHGGNVVSPANDTGVGQDAAKSPNVAGDAGGVDAGTTQVADGTQGDSYGQQVIAGASNPQESGDKAQAAEEKAAEDKAADDNAAEDKTPAAKKTAAKKTTSSSAAKK